MPVHIHAGLHEALPDDAVQGRPDAHQASSDDSGDEVDNRWQKAASAAKAKGNTLYQQTQYQEAICLYTVSMLSASSILKHRQETDQHMHFAGHGSNAKGSATTAGSSDGGPPVCMISIALQLPQQLCFPRHLYLGSMSVVHCNSPGIMSSQTSGI